MPAPSNIGRASQPDPQSREEASLTEGLPAEAAASGGRPSAIWAGHIPADNVGFRLLRKAGWSVGTGLGAGEQGRREPIEAVLPKGTRGLGFNSKASPQQQQQQQQVKKRAAHAADLEGGAGLRGPARAAASSRMAALAREELARARVANKVARHEQVTRVEEEQERGRAIEHYMRSAFNDPFDHLHSDNSNPLIRRHKLTESNPLLDPIGD